MNPISPETSERVTRKRLIDPKLKAAGWRVVPFNPIKPLAAYNNCAVEEFPTSHDLARFLDMRITF